MSRVTFITGNQKKAEHLAKYLSYPVEHKALELRELQSLDPREIIRHKVQQAYNAMQAPALVEDVSLTFKALGKLPGPFIKWFKNELGLEKICRLLDNFDDRSAVAMVIFAYTDGAKTEIFEGRAQGNITRSPKDGPHAFGWNPIFIPDGHQKTYAEMTESEIEKYGLRPSTVYPKLRQFLAQLDNQ